MGYTFFKKMTGYRSHCTGNCSCKKTNKPCTNLCSYIDCENPTNRNEHVSIDEDGYDKEENEDEDDDDKEDEDEDDEDGDGEDDEGRNYYSSDFREYENEIENEGEEHDDGYIYMA